MWRQPFCYRSSRYDMLPNTVKVELDRLGPWSSVLIYTGLLWLCTTEAC